MVAIDIDSLIMNLVISSQRGFQVQIQLMIWAFMTSSHNFFREALFHLGLNDLRSKSYE